MFTIALYRWLARALFLSGVMEWVIARTWVADPLFAHWQPASLAAWTVAAALLLQAVVRRQGEVGAATTLLLSAMAAGLGVGLVFVVTLHINVAYSFFALACTYAVLVVARSRKLWPDTPVLNALACGLVGLMCSAGVHLGPEANNEVLYTTLAAVGINSIALLACGPRLQRLAQNATPAVQASLLPWGVLVAAAGIACGVAVARWQQPPPAEGAPGELTQEFLKSKLTPEQYRCTQEGGTERPFANAYWDNKAPGIYVDLVSGEALFSSLDKYDSGTGWPSFSKPLADTVVQRSDTSLGTERTEVRSKQGNSHLGHVFDDGPMPSGQRFCINSAALRFVPLAEMKAAGYGAYLFAFAPKAGWQIATLAGGCFWGMEDIFADHPGVVQTQVGYAGGDPNRASYEQVASGTSGHAETLQVLFDPAKVSYEQLLLFFFKVHDPTTANQQGNDVGQQYRSVIFYTDETQRKTAMAVMARVTASKQWHAPLTTQVLALNGFWRAEAEHQGYIAQHPNAYTCHTERAMDFEVSAP